VVIMDGELDVLCSRTWDNEGRRGRRRAGRKD